MLNIYVAKVEHGAIAVTDKKAGSYSLETCVTNDCLSVSHNWRSSFIRNISHLEHLALERGRTGINLGSQPSLTSLHPGGASNTPAFMPYLQ